MGLTSRTGTRSTVAALAEAGWGWLVVPLDQGGPILAGMPHAIDNGAWRSHVQQCAWDEAAFLATVERHGRGALFVVCPDIVMGGAASMARSRAWLPRLLSHPDLSGVPILFAVQNGMRPEDIADLVGGRVGIFVGGDTAWKEATMPIWGKMARERGVYFHVGRVNSARRIALCAAAGADSFDGNSPVLFPKTLPLLDRARGQRDLFAPLRKVAR